MRYAYIKNGDVVDQYKRVIETWNNTTTSGPDAFIKSFIQSIESHELLLLSLSASASEYKRGNVMARTFSTGMATWEALVKHPLSLIKLFVSLLRFRPDNILCGKTGAPLWISYLAATLLSVPIVHSRHNRVLTMNDPLHRRVRSAIDHWVIRRVAAVVCHGPYLKKELLEIGVKDTTVFEFDVGFEDLLVLSNSNPGILSHCQDKQVILYIGRMERRKGIVDLFKACKNVLADDPEICLVYIGGGGGRAELEAIVRQSNASQSVFIAGEVAHDDVAGIIPLCSVVVTPTQPSFPEGRCMVVMESLALGVPVIAPDFGPFPFLVQDESNGMLYKAGSVESLKACITSYFTNPGLQSRLKLGAIETGQRLLHPDMTFGQAVQSAFKQT